MPEFEENPLGVGVGVGGGEKEFRQLNLPA